MRGKFGGPALAALTGALMLSLTPSLAFAYVGPGLGMSAFASAFSLLGAVLLGIVGFIWYPIKRLIRVLRRSRPDRP
jgi:hypothetical protein